MCRPALNCDNIPCRNTQDADSELALFPFGYLFRSCFQLARFRGAGNRRKSLTVQAKGGHTRVLGAMSRAKSRRAGTRTAGSVEASWSCPQLFSITVGNRARDALYSLLSGFLLEIKSRLGTSALALPSGIRIGLEAQIQGRGRVFQYQTFVLRPFEALEQFPEPALDTGTIIDRQPRVGVDDLVRAAQGLGPVREQTSQKFLTIGKRGTGEIDGIRHQDIVQIIDVAQAGNLAVHQFGDEHVPAVPWQAEEGLPVGLGGAPSRVLCLVSHPGE